MNSNSRENNGKWWFIEAKDGKSCGYMPGNDKEEACKNFGLDINQCRVKEVMKSPNGFIEVCYHEQKRLL